MISIWRRLTPRSMIKRNSLFIDTSGWVSYVADDQPFHRQTLAIYREAVKQKRGFATTNYIITELVALLGSRSLMPRQRIFEFIDQIQTMPFMKIVHIDEATHAQAWAMLKQYKDKVWSLVDATSFIVMRHAGLKEALATDHHFSQAGFVRLPIE